MESFSIRSVDAGILFDILTMGGDILGTSEIYRTKSACIHGTESVKKSSQTRNIEDQTKENFEELGYPKFILLRELDGSFEFRLCSRTGELLFTSTEFESKSKCMEGIERVRRNAPLASLEIYC